MLFLLLENCACDCVIYESILFFFNHIHNVSVNFVRLLSFYITKHVLSVVGVETDEGIPSSLDHIPFYEKCVVCVCVSALVELRNSHSSFIIIIIILLCHNFFHSELSKQIPIAQIFEIQESFRIGCEQENELFCSALAIKKKHRLNGIIVMSG